MNIDDNLNNNILDNNDVFNKNINDLIVKYNLDKNDPLFALIEIQLNILKEIQITKHELLNLPNLNKIDSINNISSNSELFNKLNDEFYFLSKEKLSQTEKELNIFLNNIKLQSKQEIEKFKIDIQNDINDSLLIQNISSSNNKNNISLFNIFYFILLLLTFLTILFKN